MQFRQRLLRVVLVGVFYESVSPRFTLQGARLVEEIIHLGDLAAFAKHLDEGVSCRNEKGCDGGRPVSAGEVWSGMRGDGGRVMWVLTRRRSGRGCR